MAEVARRAGCSASMLGEYERAERAPRDERLVRDLAAVLEIPADALVVVWGQTRVAPLPPTTRRNPDSPPAAPPRAPRTVRLSLALAGAVILVVLTIALTRDDGTGAGPAHAVPATTELVAQADTPAAAGPSITISAASGLRNDDRVTVIGTGYTPSSENVWIGLCAAPPSNAPVCDHESEHQAFAQVGADGGFSKEITVHPTFRGQRNGDPTVIAVDCRAPHRCFISAGQANPNIAAFQLVAFGGTR